MTTADRNPIAVQNIGSNRYIVPSGRSQPGAASEAGEVRLVGWRLSFLMMLLAICIAPAPWTKALATGVIVAQAGSVGGSIGKREKSAAGAVSSGPAHSGRHSRNAKTRASKSQRAAWSTEPQRRGRISMVGRWEWNAVCPVVGTLHGFVILRQGQDGSIVGEYGHTNSWDQGVIVGGTFDGRTFSFVRQKFDADGSVQVWTLNVTQSGAHLHATGALKTLLGPCNVATDKM